MFSTKTIGALAAMLSLSGCGLVGVVGSGTKRTEQRDVQGFDRVELRIAGDVRISKAAQDSLKITADDNLLPLILTRVEGKTLIIESNENLRSKSGIKVEVSAPALAGASISGSGAIEIDGLDSPSFEASIAGSGSLKARGSAQSVDASIAGSGHIDMTNLQSKDAKGSISGSGEIDLTATDTLNADISGSGAITYGGKPQVQSSISGSGSVQPRR